MNSKIDISNKTYGQFNDYIFKAILHSRANGLLKFMNIPYTIKKVLLSEYISLGPSISRLDFVCEAEKDGKRTSLILECQSTLPTGEDIKRFYQYVSTLRIFIDEYVDLFILCTKKAKYDKIEFGINEGCNYIMHMISLKKFKATDIFKNIENKLKNSEEITDEDIASLQVIVYTDYEESPLNILIKARNLFEKIAEKSKMDINEKKAIIYLFDVLSTNMLDDSESKQYEEKSYMLLNPMDRYCERKGREEGREEGRLEGRQEVKFGIAKNMIKKGYSIEDIVEITGLSKKNILNIK
ncbi:hypothetical protein [Methanobrevibacter sp. V74]|uniref:hypothetical protein n=1 Tax=Methanobrevibacter sp. V74 TaxID=3064279 RepID=UPI0027348341|nr:hypothetical protein [Methanobrevibacter sp. V74]